MRWAGKIGYSVQSEVAPGVWDDVITELDRVGDVVQTTEAFYQGESVLPQKRITTSISVVCDGVLKENYEDIRYLTYAGHRWAPSSVVLQWPRIVIYMGERYNGPSTD